MKNKYIFFLMSVIFSGGTLLSGCASPHVVLRDQELVPAIDASERTKVWAAQSFAITSVEDQRQRPEYWVGTAGTGMRNKPTPVELERPVATMVKTQMEKELELRGLKLANPGDIKLKVTVLELEVEEVRKGLAPEASACHAQMQVDVQPSGKAKPFRWTGKVSFQNRGTLIDTTRATASTLAGCVNLMVEKMVTNEEFKQTLTR